MRKAVSAPKPAQSGTKTVYAAIWLDQYDSDYGCYRIFNTRGEALDYIAETVMKRADWLGAKVLDNETYTKVLKQHEVRDYLGAGNDFKLVLEFDEFHKPEKYVTMQVVETEYQNEK